MKLGSSNVSARLSSELRWISEISVVFTCTEYEPSYGLVWSTTQASSPSPVIYQLQHSQEKSLPSNPSQTHALVGEGVVGGGVAGALVVGEDVVGSLVVGEDVVGSLVGKDVGALVGAAVRAFSGAET